MSTIYEVLRRPLITEKTNYQNADLHQYAFEVTRDATNVLVKDAVEQLFDVNVVRVNMINVAPKRTRQTRNHQVKVRRKAYKKAIVTLAPGDSIAIFEGVK